MKRADHVRDLPPVGSLVSVGRLGGDLGRSHVRNHVAKLSPQVAGLEDQIRVSDQRDQQHKIEERLSGNAASFRRRRGGLSCDRRLPGQFQLFCSRSAGHAVVQYQSRIAGTAQIIFFETGITTTKIGVVLSPRTRIVCIGRRRKTILLIRKLLIRELLIRILLIRKLLIRILRVQQRPLALLHRDVLQPVLCNRLIPRGVLQ